MPETALQYNIQEKGLSATSKRSEPVSALEDHREQSQSIRSAFLEDNRQIVEKQELLDEIPAKRAGSQAYEQEGVMKGKNEGKAGTLADLYEAPVILPRNKTEEREDLKNAGLLLSAISKQAKTTKEIEAYFPAIQKRYALSRVQFLKNGKDGLKIELNINPTLYFTNFNNQEVNFDDSQADKQTPQYTTNTLTLPTGEQGLVGTSMTAHMLGPYHPQGSSPGSNEQSGLFDGLPTKGKVAKGSRTGTNLYIKGHLLNDNLGGPGVAKNLYPITAQANGDHERDIESVAKELVNVRGLYVYYQVVVAFKDKKAIGNGLSYVDADFVCHLAPLRLNSNGQMVRHLYKNVTIHSRYNNKVVSSDHSGNSLASFDHTDKDSVKQDQFDATQVKWAPSKYAKLQIGFNEDAIKELDEFTDEGDFLKEVGKIDGIGDEKAKMAWYVFENKKRNENLNSTQKGHETKAIKAINEYATEQQDIGGYNAAKNGVPLIGDETDTHKNAHQLYHTQVAQGRAMAKNGLQPTINDGQGVRDGHQAYNNEHDRGYKMGIDGIQPFIFTTDGEKDGYQKYQNEFEQGRNIAQEGYGLQPNSAQGLINGHYSYHYNEGYAAARRGDGVGNGLIYNGRTQGHQAYFNDHASGYTKARNNLSLGFFPSYGEQDGHQLYWSHFSHGKQLAQNNKFPAINAPQGVKDGHYTYHFNQGYATAQNGGQQSDLGLFPHTAAIKGFNKYHMDKYFQQFQFPQPMQQ